MDDKHVVKRHNSNDFAETLETIMSTNHIEHNTISDNNNDSSITDDDKNISSSMISNSNNFSNENDNDVGYSLEEDDNQNWQLPTIDQAPHGSRPTSTSTSDSATDGLMIPHPLVFANSSKQSKNKKFPSAESNSNVPLSANELMNAPTTVTSSFYQSVSHNMAAPTSEQVHLLYIKLAVVYITIHCLSGA